MSSGVSKPRRKLAAILMVDVSGFSRMMSRDEEGTTARIREFHTRTRSLIEEHEGWVVDTAGDSVFGEFDSVVNAVRCAQVLQDAQAAVNATRPPGEQIETRIGVHLGDVIVQEHHVYGDGVNVAARLQAAADPGGIYVSEAVYQQVHNELDLAFEDLGVREFKNIEYPVHLFRVVSPGHDRPAASPQAPQRDRQRPGASPSRLPPVSWTEALLLRTTYNPAQALGLAETLGHLSVGAIADIAVLEVQEGDFEFIDTDKNIMTGRRRLSAVMTIKDGRIWYQAGEPTGSPSLKPRSLLT